MVRISDVRGKLVNRNVAACFLGGCSLLTVAVLLYLQTPRGQLHLLLWRIDRQMGRPGWWGPLSEQSYMLGELLKDHPSFDSILHARLSNPEEKPAMRLYLMLQLWTSLPQTERMSYFDEFLRSRRWDLFFATAAMASEMGSNFAPEEKETLVSLIEQGVKEGFVAYTPTEEDLSEIELAVKRLKLGPADIASPTGETQGGLSESEIKSE